MLAALGLFVGGCAGLGIEELTGSGPTQSVLDPSVIDLAQLGQPARPPSLVAYQDADVARLVEAVDPRRLGALMAERGSKSLDAPASPFFFESDLGRAYLAAGLRGERGRAVARGAPAERCPYAGVAMGARTLKAAAVDALSSCLAQRSPRDAARPPAKAGAPRPPARCGCRLMAAGDVLLARPQAFAYARGAPAHLVDARGLRPVLVAEERAAVRSLAAPPPPELLGALAAGARRLWLLAPSGPRASLELAADGAARLIFVEGPPSALIETAVFEGRWRAEGYRRGRRASVVALRKTAPDAAPATLIVFIGYDPAELAARGAVLRGRADAMLRRL